ncbi:MAG: hypothetical protein R2932_33765 [Caldilineaceae bacterium]
MGDEEIGTSITGGDNRRFMRRRITGYQWRYSRAGVNDADDDGDGLSNTAEVRDGWDNGFGHYYTNPVMQIAMMMEFRMEKREISIAILTILSLVILKEMIISLSILSSSHPFSGGRRQNCVAPNHKSGIMN